MTTDASGSPGGDDRERLRLLQKIELARERDVEEFLMMTQGSESQKGADNPQMARLKQHFEKKNKRHTNELEQLQRKLATYEQRLVEIENGIDSGSRTTVMSTVGQGIRYAYGMTETVMAAPLEFAQRLKSTFGSADNVNDPNDGANEQVWLEVVEDSVASSLYSKFRYTSRKSDSLPANSSLVKSSTPSRSRDVDTSGLTDPLLKVESEVVVAFVSTNLFLFRLETTMNETIELHQAEFQALKQEQKGIANRLDYQYNDRFKRVEESVESVENHVEFLKIVLYLVATVLDLFLPFFGTRSATFSGSGIKRVYFFAALLLCSLYGKISMSTVSLSSCLCREMVPT
ncbi:unnamed protein product [Haemonchus placei]|uniref:Transmembrane protein n=1 Tax=Haemonchus placei TaxID=6290 RepID=A0A0N4W1L9_HAEPC|nr:unnamed protein product [Haemonchus placei]